LQLTIYPPTITTTKEADGTRNVVPAPTPGDLSNKIYDDNVTVTIYTALYAGSNVGNHLITIVYAISGADANNYIKPVDYTRDGVIVAKMPNITWPPAQTVDFEQNKTLADVPITGGTGAGTFVWTNPGNPVGNIGTHSHNMTFTPDDLTTYGPITGYVNVIVRGPQTINITFAQIIVNSAPMLTSATISLSNSNGHSNSLSITLDDSSQYSTIEWFLNGEYRPGAIFTFTPTALDVGPHTLMLRVRKDGSWYSRTIRITVVP
jgi:hypothetical protein